MRTIKDKYFFLILIVLIAYIVNLNYEFINNEKVNLLLGFIALITAIISLGLADARQNKLNVKLNVWSQNETHMIGGKEKISGFAFKIINKGSDAIEGLVVSFRFQKSLFYVPSKNKQNNYYFEFGERIVAQNDTFKYLGISKYDNYIIYEHYLKEIDEWKKGSIAVTVSGNGYMPKTFNIGENEKDLLMKSKNGYPVTYT